MDILLIGIDGGATKVNGWVVDVKKDGFSLADRNIQKKYSEYRSYKGTFKPVDIKVQLAEMNTEIFITENERIQGLAYKSAAADVIIGLAKSNPSKKLLIGFGMPGLKTTDKRGISALANGPRMPYFVESIERKLKDENIDFFPITHLGSDADYCGIGEQYDVDGAFKDVENAYYLGGGTGVADAMKLKGNLITFDNMKPWIAKSWEMKTKTGLSLERCASAGGIQYIYSMKSGTSIDELNKSSIYPPQILEKALSGDESALNTINEVEENISKLLFERMTTLYYGYNGIFDFVNPLKPSLETNHPFKGLLLDRIVIGQRLGDLLEESKSTSLLWNEILKNMYSLVVASGDKRFINHYLNGNEFNQDIIKISNLREAPVIGAGVDAYLEYKKS